MENKFNNEPKLDALTATRVLENVFEESDVALNTIPAVALAGFPQFKRQGFTAQRAIMIVILILWLLIPILFFSPKFDIGEVQMNEQNLPVYTIEVTSMLPVLTVDVQMDGESVQLFKKDAKTFAVEPSRNGVMDIRVTAVNRQTTTRSVAVSGVDDVGPKLLSSRMDDSRVYLQMAENGTGVSYENIYAQGRTSGEIVKPESIDRENGTIIFKLPKEKWDVYIPDNRGNALHLSMEMK